MLWTCHKITVVQKISRLLEALTGEIHHRPIVGLLAILVLLVHLWVIVLLLQPAAREPAAKPIKVMEVALVTEPKPKNESPPPASPTKPPVQPKKKEVKPPIKKKAPVIPKPMEPPKPQTVGDVAIPKPSVPKEAERDPQTPTSTLSPTPLHKPVTASGNGDAVSKGANSGVVELGCPKPVYPMRAMSRHIEGWVKVELTIGASGAVSNAVVVGSQPQGIFDDAALSAGRQCKFKPKIVNGNAVSQRGVKKLTFKLTN